MRNCLAAWILGSGLLASTAFAAPGEYWEITNKMEMQGMSMPGMTQKVCVAKGKESDPRSSTDKDCEMTDLKVSGNKSSWKMRCNKNGEVMTGSGEMTYTADRTEGTINFSTAKTGSVTMNFINKRIGGACDSDEIKKKIEGQMAANNREMAKMCEGATTGQEWLSRSSMILGSGAPCADKKEAFCEVMKRDAGRNVDVYFSLKNPPYSTSVPQGCGISLDAAKKALCKSVDIGNADFSKQMRGDMRSYNGQRLRAECPAEMKVYAEQSRKRYCEGRGFTEKQRMSLADCLKGGSGDDQAMNTPDPDEPPMPGSKHSTSQSGSQSNPSDSGKSGMSIPGLPGNIPADAVIDGAKKLKNLFGF